MFEPGQKLRALRDIPPTLPGDLSIVRGGVYEAAKAGRNGNGQFVRLAGDHPGRSLRAEMFEPAYPPAPVLRQPHPELVEGQDEGGAAPTAFLRRARDEGPRPTAGPRP